MELLKRHKIARDAGILSQVEFMQLYNSITNESMSSLSPTSSITISSQPQPQPQPQPVLEASVFQVDSSSLLQSSPTTSVVPIAPEDSGPDKVYKYILVEIYNFIIFCIAVVFPYLIEESQGFIAA